MMKKVQVINISKQTVILTEAEVADTFFSRLKGLLGRSSLPPGRGILIKPCRAVHTMGMSFPIDVGFVDRESRLQHSVHRMPPYRFSPTVKAAAYVIEAPAGTFAATHTAPGDMLEIKQLDP